MNSDMNRVEAFAGQVVTDIAAAFSGVMTNIGHKLGLYKAMAGAGWLSSDQLADRTDTHERYVREWLDNQTAGGYVKYDPETRRYRLPDEHIPVLADDDSPLFLVPALEVASALWMDDGTLLLVEPAAGDDVEDNINPVSRLYYAASTAVCTPCSKSQEVVSPSVLRPGPFVRGAAGGRIPTHPPSYGDTVQPDH